MKIVIDISVANCHIFALKPEIQIPMPDTDAEKIIWWGTVDLQRLNKRVAGTLKGNALKKAEKIVDKYGMINMSGEYGSIEVNEDDLFLWRRENEYKYR